MKAVMKGASKLIVSRKEIDLSKTLLMGQAFRWIQVEQDVFRGVIGDQMFHLSQQNNLIEYQSYKTSLNFVNLKIGLETAFNYRSYT